MNSRTHKEKKMKWLIAGTAMAALLATPLLASAQTQEKVRTQTETAQMAQNGPKDHDGDGIPNGQDPDYSGQGKAARGSGQQVSKGQSDAASKGAGKAFVDNDGDGVCDNYQSTDKASGGNSTQKKGSGQAMKQGRGKGQGFVDSNKDGICDNYQAGNMKQGTGKAR